MGKEAGIQIGILATTEGLGNIVRAVKPLANLSGKALDALANAVRSSGKFDTTVDSLADARKLIKKAMPDAVELPPAVAGKPYPSPPPGVKQWYQVQPAEPGVGNNLPHIKYSDWTAGKKGTGGSWGHIFFSE